MWEAIFAAIAAGFQFFGKLLPTGSKVAAAEDVSDPPAARVGTAAGAAANEAAHIAEHKKASS